MIKGDGLNRNDRVERVTSVRPFRVIDNDICSLLRQVERIASFIRYYNFNREPEGYWDELLSELKKIHCFYKEKGYLPQPDGNMEPSQSVILIFLQQLHKLTDSFNNRWMQLPYWYINEVLGIESLPPLADKVWICFEKNIPGIVFVRKGERFKATTAEGGMSFIYRMTSDFQVENTTVEKAFSIWFEKKKHIFPASELDAVTSLRIKDLLNEECGMNLMFAGEKNLSHAQSPGFMIASASLLLREGKRVVTVTLEAENRPLTTFITRRVDPAEDAFDFTSETAKYVRLIDNIFYLQISTADGWKVLNHYTVRHAEDCRDDLVIRFILPEDFPATAACEDETHNFCSDYPVLKVLLNLDAWLYPYSWIKDFLLRRIRIHTCVEGVTNLLVYNELGRIDNSKPFQPFGLNTERGTWFAIGNYEMAVRPTLSLNVSIQWGQLPCDEYGLKEYYEGYEAEIDNTSFRIRPRYLNDYNWRYSSATRQWYLFSSQPSRPDGTPGPSLPLSPNTYWKNIPVDKMTPVTLPEDLYEYSIQSKNGFVSFLLDEPAIGFGEKRYRYLFTERMMRQTIKKKNHILLNPPIVPVIERITLDYEAEEIIDLRTHRTNDCNRFYHVFPLGCKQMFPNRENTSIPLIYKLESDANVILGLHHAKGGKFIRLYLDFVPVNREIADMELPRLRWYYGDGYSWRPMPDSVIENDTTRNLLTGGCIDFYLPEDIDRYHSEQTGLVWIRAGIEDHADYIPDLAGIYVNVAELELEIDDPADDRWQAFRKTQKDIRPVRSIPGITAVKNISTFQGGREKETDRNKLIRISEYVTHRGRAVTPRDYERLTLQRFTVIEKVKCIPALDTKHQRAGVVTVVVIPKNDSIMLTEWRPKASSALILVIEEYLNRHVSATVEFVDVINPEYEELMIRCRVIFKRKYSSGASRRRLKELCDRMIAPWQPYKETPSFDYFIRLQTVYDTIREQEYILSVDELSVIRLTEKKEEHYVIHEYNGEDEIIRPSEPYAIFVPAREHLFLMETETPFGISEMTIDETFVVE